MPGEQVALVVNVGSEGEFLGWKSPLPIPLLNLLLDKVKFDIHSGRVKETPVIFPPTNGDMERLTRP